MASLPLGAAKIRLSGTLRKKRFAHIESIETAGGVSKHGGDKAAKPGDG